ncbi:MAG TPA: tetratricopeptide repeat protein, partial [Chthoniobacterales bacterium]
MKSSLRNWLAILVLFLAASPGIAQADAKTEASNYRRVGIEAAKNKQWDKAIINFKKAAELDPAANNRNNLGVAYRQRGLIDVSGQKYDEAISDFTEALKNNSDDLISHQFRAFAYLSKKEWEKSLEDYNALLKQKGDDPEPLIR